MILPQTQHRVRGEPRLAFDVVIRNLLVGHRFPGGVLDIQDTWVEVEVADRNGRRLATSGLDHERTAGDDEAHVLRTLVVDETGNVLEHHEMPRFRTQIATQTLAPREAQVIRYELAVPARAAQPLVVTARLRHRSRTLAMQAEVCRAANTREGREFLVGARGARDVELDPCRPQPITLIAATTVELGGEMSARPAWERLYEHGMALVAAAVGATLLPIVYKPSKTELAAARERFPLVLKMPATSTQHLEAIDQAMKSRPQGATQPRS